jgi:hypothetical protein
VKRRGTWLCGGAALVLTVGAVAATGIVRSSAPASPQEIAATIASTDPACRPLLRRRLASTIAERGAVSRRTLETRSHEECMAAGRQLAAVERE